MINEPLKLGFIGGALDSAVGLTHKIASEMDGRWSIQAGCFSSNQDSNTQTGTLWGIEKNRIYTDWQQLLKQEHENLDAVVILTPTPSHAEIVKEALLQKWAVICEKALATSSKEAVDIQKSQQDTAGFLAVTYNYTGYPMLRELKLIIESGQLGNINQVHIEMPQEGFLRLNKEGQKPSPQSWRLNDGTIPTLSLDLGVHVHHIIKFLTDEKPQEVVAINNTFGFFEEIIDNTLCIAKYTNNLDCQIWFGKTALGHSNGLRVRVYGNKGAAEWYQMEPETIKLSDSYGRKQIIERSSADLNISNLKRYERFKPGHPTGFIEAFANHYYDLADALIEFRKSGFIQSNWVFGVEDALEGLLMLEATFESAKTKSWVHI